jgi:hypothetical protein
MALTYTYPDAYLRPLVDEAREAQAIADVADLGTLPASWVLRLTRLRAYILTCLECQKTPDDTFAAKLAAYRKEWPTTLQEARLAQSVADAAANGGGSSSVGGGFGFVGLERS